MRQWKRDLILSIGLIVFCIVNIFYAEFMVSGTMQYKLARADSYMELWLIILLILSVLLLIRTLKKKPDNIVTPIWTRLSAFILVMLAVYLLVMPYLGFFIDTVVFLTVLIAVYSLSIPHKKKEGFAFYRQFVVWFIVSLLSTIVIYYLFANILRVVFPKFSLF